MPDFVDFAPISGTRITSAGYLVGDALCARMGCQDYLASDIGMEGSGTVTVYRPESVVFDKASLATFAGKPVTMGHPAEPVTADNWRLHAIGDVGTDIARDGDGVRVPYKIMDASAIMAIQGGAARQISMGYTTGLTIGDGVAPDGTAYQATQTGPIIINHLAIVPVARGGSTLRIGDGAAQWGATPLTDGKDVKMPDGIKTRTVIFDGLSIETNDAGATALEKMIRDAAALAVAHVAALAAKDVQIATLDAKATDLASKVLDGRALDKLVQDRTALVVQARAVAPALVTDGLSASDIRKGAVIAAKGAAMADKSEAFIDAMFEIIAADAEPADPAARALADALRNKPDDISAIYAARDAALQNAWKGEAA